MTETELILAIEERPGLFIGHKTITGLKHFLDGYASGVCDSGGGFLRTVTQEFGVFVAKWYRLPEALHWSRVLLVMANTEEEAFDDFMRLFHLFIDGIDPVSRKLK